MTSLIRKLTLNNLVKMVKINCDGLNKKAHLEQLG